MDTNIPAECPSCATGGVRSSVRLYQINLEEAAVFCENQGCPFPLFSQDLCPLVVPHTVITTATHSLPQPKPRSMDTDSMASSCSASSWTSNASTVSSISSNIATPPPTISSKPFSWPTNPTSLVYQPKAIAPKQKHTFDWISPISSAQTSPASSIVSANDREVEFVMKKSSYLPPNSGLTPSPSPLLSELLDSGASQPSDDIDSYIDSFSFLDDIISGPSESIQTLPSNNQDTRIDNESSSQSSEELVSKTTTIAQKPSETSKSIESSRVLDDEVEEISLEKSAPKLFSLLKQPSKAKALINSRSSTSEADLPPILEPPAKKRVIETRKSRVKVSSAVCSVSSSDESTPTTTPTPQSPRTTESLVSKSKVAVDVRSDGTPVFIIHPVVPVAQPAFTAPSLLSSPKSPSKKVSAKKAKNQTVTPRGRRKADMTDSPVITPASPPTSTKSTKPKASGTKKKANSNPFCIDTLVKKFVQAAKNKKLPDT